GDCTSVSSCASTPHGPSTRVASFSAPRWSVRTRRKGCRRAWRTCAPILTAGRSSRRSADPMKVSFVLYRGVEPIDLAVLGVFSMATRVIPDLRYETVAATLAPVTCSNGLRVLPDRTFDEVSDVDVLMIPGGPGWRDAACDERLLALIRKVHPGATVASICTGAMVLAETGLLEGRRATTKK